MFQYHAGPLSSYREIDVDRHARRRREHRRQPDHRRVGPERLRQIDDRDPAGGEVGDERGRADDMMYV